MASCKLFIIFNISNGDAGPRFPLCKHNLQDVCIYKKKDRKSWNVIMRLSKIFDV